MRACSVLPTLNIAVRVEFMARHVPSSAGIETSEDFETLFVAFPLINSQYCRPENPNSTAEYDHSSHAPRSTVSVSEWTVVCRSWEAVKSDLTIPECGVVWP